MSKILIVDDQFLNVQTLIVGLKQESYTLHVANNGHEALTLAQTIQPDLILLDILMPDIDGFEVCRQLKAIPANADIPVIFLTALDEPINKLRGLEVGGEDYITKPFSIDEVRARVKVHLALREKQLQLERLREQDRLYFTAINKFRDEMLAQLQHDVKNPLTGIRTSLYLLTKVCDTSDPRIKEYIRRADLAIEEVIKMMNQMLEVAKLETQRAIEMRPVGMFDYMQRILDSFETAAQAKRIKLLFDFDLLNRETQLCFDPEHMTIVLKNLIGNAIKYTASNGKVQVRVSVRDEQLILIVADTGCGIPEEHLQRIFQRFYRVPTEHVIEGTGLGLYIVKSIIEQHGGTITVQSKVNKGSVFTVAIPYQQVVEVHG